MIRAPTFSSWKTTIERLNVPKKTALIAVIAVASIVVLGLKLLNPTNVQIFVENKTTIINQSSMLFTYTDILTIVIATILLNISVMFLLFSNATSSSADSSLQETRKNRWESVAQTLKEGEQKIYRAVIEEEGIIAQSELAEKTGYSKTRVSRTLYVLESKGLVERRRRGMGNVVLLK